MYHTHCSKTQNKTGKQSGGVVGGRGGRGTRSGGEDIFTLLITEEYGGSGLDQKPSRGTNPKIGNGTKNTFSNATERI